MQIFQGRWICKKIIIKQNEIVVGPNLTCGCKKCPRKVWEPYIVGTTPLYLVKRVFFIDGVSPRGWRVSNDLSDRVPVSEEKMLECDVAVIVEVGVSVPEVTKYHELCRHQNDFDKLQKEFPGCLTTSHEFFDWVHEEKSQASSQLLLKSVDGHK